MSVLHFNRLQSSSACLALIACGALTLSLPASAQQMAAAAGGIETVVVSGTQFDPDVAPAKARLETMEPQTIINRSYIEDSAAETADYTSILAIAPSMTGMSLNGPGLSDGGVKNTLRGIPDGNFGLTYDGIPIGDTNGPTHHSESYFPGSTIGSIDVDRGPGNAGNIGASTFGGSINMFSDVLTPEQSARASATYGSFGTKNFSANLQSGDLDFAGTTTRVMGNVQVIDSDGYLTFNTTSHNNYLIKVQNEFAPGWTVTAFAIYNNLDQTLNDNAGETAAQVIAYGKTFALQNTNPNLGTYTGYNYVRKKTDNDYIRLEGSIGGVAIDNTSYTYAYTNKTQTATTIMQTTADIMAGVTEANGTVVGGVSHPNDVPGYTKLNAYRVWGNVFRASEDFDFGGLTGQLRGGVWWEGQATERQRWDYDLTQCLAQQCDTFHADYTKVGDATLANAKTPTAALIPGRGYAEYVEHSDWNQYQPFVELELHPFEGLTVTPGFKYVDWTRNIDGEPEQKTKPKVNFSGSSTTIHDLPFVMANYKIEQSWSVYAQYAQGIYVPDIGSFEQATPTFTYPKAETTTNYQAGTVYYADNFTFDADVYYIGIDNNITTTPCGPLGGPTGDTCYVNTGTATYKGIEGEGTYAFDNNVFGGALDGLAIFANASLISGKSSGKWLKQVPMWTGAAGLIYKSGNFKVSLVDKGVGQQYSDASNSQFYKLAAYNNADLKTSLVFGNFEVGFGLYNLFNARSLIAVTVNDSKPIGGASVYDIANRGGSLDQYSFAPSRSYQITLKAAL